MLRSTSASGGDGLPNRHDLPRGRRLPTRRKHNVGSARAASELAVAYYDSSCRERDFWLPDGHADAGPLIAGTERRAGLGVEAGPSRLDPFAQIVLRSMLRTMAARGQRGQRGASNMARDGCNVSVRTDKVLGATRKRRAAMIKPSNASVALTRPRNKCR